MNSNFIKCWLQALLCVQKGWGVLLLAALLTLTGCGGGTASSTSTDNDLPSPVAGSIDGEVLVPSPSGVPPAPVSALELLPKVSVGQRQFADPNVLLNLRGTVEAAANAQIVKTLWTQVIGPQVIIPSPLALENVILMPDVNIATQLEFRLTAEDNEGRVNSATVSILIQPVPTFVKVIGGVFTETDGNAIFTVRLNAPSQVPITISYVTQDGSAKSSTDYVSASGEVVLAAGEVMKDVSVALTNDFLEEGDETFSLQVTAVGGEQVHANSGVAIIRNGAEPMLPQSLQFTNAGPVTIYLKSQYSNPINTIVALSGTGAMVYMSSNPLVATVDANGLVIPVSLGTTKITAIKYADKIYLPAEASYDLQVAVTGAVPQVYYDSQEGTYVWDQKSVALGEMLYFSGSAIDAEDGNLPSQAEINAFELNGTPITSVRWDSNIDGFLAYGNSFNTNTLAQGTHVITYSATDSDGNVGSTSIRVLVGNVAPLGFASASSTFCSNPSDGINCYYPDRTNDSSLSTVLGGFDSWTNNNLSTTPLPQWLMLSWSSPVTINSLDLYTTVGFLIRDYDIEYLNGNNWAIVASVTNNTTAFRTHTISTITTSALRVLAKKGSVTQPQYARINELVVFGTMTSSSSNSSSSAVAVTSPVER